MTKVELAKCLEDKGITASKLADDIGVNRSAVSRWVKGSNKIDLPTTRLLRLYFYGEIPFGIESERPDLKNTLKLSEYELNVIKILANREGVSSPTQWVVNKIRDYIRGFEKEAANKQAAENEMARKQSAG